MDESTALQVARELGSMDARIGNIEKDGAQTRGKVDDLQHDVTEIKGDIKALQSDVKALLARPVTVVEPSGGRPLLTIGASTAGGLGVGGLLVAAAQYVLGGGVPQQPPPPPPPTVQAQPQAQAERSSPAQP